MFTKVSLMTNYILNILFSKKFKPALCDAGTSSLMEDFLCLVYDFYACVLTLPFSISMTPFGHAETHIPHPTHKS